MAGTIYGTNVYTGITLTQTPATIASGVYVTNTGNGGRSSAVYGGPGVPPPFVPWNGGTVTNYGTVIGQPTLNGDGIYLGGGGGNTIINGSPSQTTALISGAGGISSGFLSPLTVKNYGTIEGSTDGAISAQGGTVTNGSAAVTTALISGASDGILLSSGITSTIRNYGTVQSSGTGIWLEGGGSVTNGSSAVSTALVSSSGDGIIIQGGTGIVINFGTIESTSAGTNGEAIYLGAGGTIINYGLIKGAHEPVTATYGAMIITHNQYATIRNFGTIAPTNISNGISLDHGGTIINGSTGVTRALIIGSENGIAVGEQSVNGIYGSGAAGMIINYGTIQSTGTAATAVRLFSGGTVTNEVTGSIESDNIGVDIRYFSGNILNLGTIHADNGQGVYLGAGGTATNRGVITNASTAHAGISVHNVAGTVINSGKIESAGNQGIYFEDGGTVTNKAGGLIRGGDDGVCVLGGAGRVVNSGSIESKSTGTSGHAIYLAAGGTVINEAGGLITGSHPGSAAAGYPGAVEALNVRATVDNFGRITNSDTGNGINLLAGGTVINGSTAITTALISGSADGIYMGGTLGTPTTGGYGVVSNFGTIENTSTVHDDVHLASGGKVTNRGLITSRQTAIAIGNGIGKIVNSGSIESKSTGTSGHAIYLAAGGTVINEAGGLITGSHPGSAAAGYPGAVEALNVRATVDNFGRITNSDTGNGINLLAGGTVINGSTAITTALISGSADGIYMGGTLGTPTTGGYGVVSNFGTIENTSTVHDDVHLASGGKVTNRGLITSRQTAIAIGNGIGKIVNSGTIRSTSTGTIGQGIYIGSGGTVTNEVGGQITALRSAVVLGGTIATTAAALVSNSGVIKGSIGVVVGSADTGANRVLNYGTITGTGGTAVSFGAGKDVFIEEAGGAVHGAIIGGAGNDVFEFAAGGLTWADTVTGGAGTDTLEFTTAGTVTSAAFTHVTGIDVIRLANGTNALTLNDAMVAGSDHERVTVEGGSTDRVNAAAVAAGATVVFNDNGAADTITGGKGNNIYEFDNKTGGALTIANAFSGGTAAHGDLEFGPGLGDEDLWFLKSGNNLVAEVLGTTEKVTIDGWFASNKSAQVSEITAGGLKLDSGVASLVQAMATFQTDNPSFNPTTAHTTMPTDTTLQHAIAAAWHT